MTDENKSQAAEDQQDLFMEVTPSTDIARSPLPALPGLYQAEDRAVSFIGKPLTALAAARTRGSIKTNDITNIDTMTIRDEVEIISAKARALGVGESKLLSVAVSAFTKVNAHGTGKPHLRITLDTKDFAIANRKEIIPRIMETPEAQEKEDKRTAKNLENFVAKLVKNAENLKTNMRFKWKDKIRGKATEYADISFIGAARVNKNNITLEFTQSAAEIITTWPLAERPRAFYAIDDKQTNAYSIADALIAHYTNENNVIRNTERVMNIGLLISKYTSLPSQEEVKAKKLGWEHFVKEKFELAMDHLVAVGLLTNWEYRAGGKKILSDDEATAIYSYDQFASLYLYFDLAGFEDHDKRLNLISAKRKEKEEADKEKKRRRNSKRSSERESEEGSS